MTHYSISTLEVLSGVKAHTIRIWEQRYSILQPKRTDTNIRYYNDEQLQKLLSVSTLLQNGFRISKISALSPIELTNEVDAILNQNGKENEGVITAYINKLISTSLTYNALGFEQIYAKMKEQLSTNEIFFLVLMPLMKIILYKWKSSKINPEKKHFLSSLIRQKLTSAIDRLPLPAANAEEKWLLFLPPNEHQDIALLYAHYLLKLSSKTVLYLGANVPVSDIKKVASSFNPTHSLFLLFSQQTTKAGQRYLQDIQIALPNCKLIASGNTPLIEKLKTESEITYMGTLSEFKNQYLA